MNKLNFEELVSLKLLLSINSIGPHKVLTLVSKFRAPGNVLSSSYSSLTQTEGISNNLANRILSSGKYYEEARENFEKELTTLEKVSGRIISYWDDEYPKMLKNIYSPPIILYVIGEFKESDKCAISIVGTRNPTNYGKTCAEKFSRELAANNITIISGLARGIDSIAHRGALRAGGRTIAVIGSGLDVIYPPENKDLFDSIAENGMIISEFEPGTKPDAQNFPRRNRIISGLSLGSLLIETKLNGGAMQTASYALDQNREVFAVPGNIGSPQSEGTNILIQKGEAKLVRLTEDILNELELKLKPVIGKSIPKPAAELNLFEEKIISVLDSEPKHIDKIAEETELSVTDCLIHLLSLEFKDMVKQFPGKNFALI